MNFVSSEYALLLLVTLLASVASRGRATTYVVLAASLVFYGWWNPIFLLLLLAVIVLSWAGALVVGRWRSKSMLAAVVVGELSLLLYFKYATFIALNARALAGLLHLPAPGDLPPVLLPAGISFMTFQGVAYVIDVYRGHLTPVRSFVDVALFKSFFPQLVAGPIERGPHLLPQLRALEGGFWNRASMARGTFMIMKGVFFKFVIADNMSTVVNGVYGNVPGASAFDTALAVYAFTIQIYCDFYGYTMIALGSASLFAVDLVNNFEHPYLATSIQDFWRRWHISLSQWFRDYLYIPLGGNRVGLARHLFNLLLVMFAVGLWHGANWTFVVWGAMHGLALALHVVWRRMAGLARLPIPEPVARGLGWVVTVHFVALAWIPFRSPDLQVPWVIAGKWMTWLMHPTMSPTSVYGLPFYLWLGVAFAAVEWLDAMVDLQSAYERLPGLAQASVLFGLCLATYLGPLKDVAFLYFQF